MAITPDTPGGLANGAFSQQQHQISNPASPLHQNELSSGVAWTPLPKVQYGFAIFPFSPENDVAPQAESTLDEASVLALQQHLIALEVGDEVYLFEQLGGEKAQWTRGYVVSTSRIPTAAATLASLSQYSAFSSTSASESAASALLEEPQVYVGIFPISHIHVREHLDDAEMRLAKLYAQSQGKDGAILATSSSASAFTKNQMETLPEEDENISSQPNSPMVANPPSGGSAKGKDLKLQVRAGSTETGDARPPPPLPSLKCGDETVSGTMEPLADEIACALREWSGLMYTHLAKGRYALFESVQQEFDALHGARRQLLAQTLSEDEVSRLRRECVARLVKGNVLQGLDVIVRHPVKGGLVTVDFPGASSTSSDSAAPEQNQVSGIKLYALQVALAYLNQHHLQDTHRDAHNVLSSSFTESSMAHVSSFLAPSTGPSESLGELASLSSGSSLQLSATGPLNGSFGMKRISSISGHNKISAGAVASDGSPADAYNRDALHNNVKYFHVFLDIRACVANPCSPHETAELYFSLYNKAEARFLTEEYCLILNHHGFPVGNAASRDRTQASAAKMSTVFTNLSANDMQDLNIVCRIIRNGSMRINSASVSPPNPDNGQDQATLRDRRNAATPGIDHSVNDASHGSNGFASSSSKHMTTERTFRRPFGCAVLSLGQDHQFETELSNSSVKKEHVMPILVPVNEAAFSTLHQDIIASRVREFEKSPRAELIAVDVKVFHGHLPTLIRENPSLLSETPQTARLGFPDVVFPDDSRNEAYFKLWSGEFYPGGSKMPGAATAKNIQVSIEVRTFTGKVLPNVISRGSGEALVTRFDSTVFYHQNTPTWGELIKLVLPDEIMEQCHLFLTFRHRSSKEERPLTSASNGSNAALSSNLNYQGSFSGPPFACGYLPLFDKSAAFIQDGSHTLFLWRNLRPEHPLSPELYFSLPATVPINQSITDVVPPSLQSLIQPLRDNVMLRSFLVSTKYTQNDVLLKLFQWERALSEDIEELKNVLVKFTFVGEVEIVKFLRDIFDALFAILVHTRNSNSELDDLVFNALVTVISIVQDRRFTNFKATLDVYIDQHFKSQTVHTRLMASLTRLLSDPTRSDTSKELRASIKVWPHLFRFIVRSRENQRSVDATPASASVGAEAVRDHFETKFRSDLDGLLRSINRLMAATKPPSIVGTQALALQFFAGILPDLAKVYNSDELVAIETAFADSIFITKGRMVVWKLLHIVHVVNAPLFDLLSSRSQLIPSIVRWIRPHLGSFSETLDDADGIKAADIPARDVARVTWLEGARLAVSVLAITLDRLQANLTRARKGESANSEVRQEQDNVDYVLSMVPRLLETYLEMRSKAMTQALERHRSPSTIASAVPVIFPSTSSFPLIARYPEGTSHGSVRPSSTRRNQPSSAHHEFLNCGLGEIAAVLSVLIMLSPAKHLAGFLDEQLDLEGPKKLVRFLENFFKVATSIIINEAFPSTWLNINVLAHQMVLKMASPLSALMIRDFVPTADESESFNTHLWKACLDMLLALLSSEQLTIEQFQPQRRRAVWRLAGDIRGEGAQIFARLWNSIGWPDQTPPEKGATTPRPRRTSTDQIAEPPLDGERLNTGGFQVQFVPSLVEPVLELCLSHHDELRTCAVRVLATMITSEWHLNGNFSVIEAEIIDKLDVLFIADTKGDEISRAFFIGQLRSLFESPEVEPKLRDQLLACLVSVNRFLDLLLSVRSLPLEDGYEDSRIAGTLKLLGFLRQENRVSAFSTHVLKLVNLHLNHLNYVEAALTLKLHADLHTWEMDTFVDAVPELSLPRQSHFARRETLYMLILDYLGKGQAWEISIDICRELAQQYEYRAVDYTRLAELLNYQATLFRKIFETERVFPSYFRVAYYGEGWPVALQQKMFVYRGLELDKLTAFCDRLQQKHPGAILLQTSVTPSDDVRYAPDTQYLQVTALQPEPDRSRDIFTNQDVPATVRAYYEHNGTNLFSYARPFRKNGGNRREAADAVNLWVEKTYLRCEDAFPSVLRRSEVAEVHIVELSPLENALSDVETKTQELLALEKRYVAMEEVHVGAGKHKNINTNRLAMALNGAVDAPINGGIPLYRKTFLDTDNRQAGKAETTDEAALLARLKEAISQQALAIARCIRVHARLCVAEMQPFHETLVRFFSENFAGEIRELRINTRSLRAHDVDGRDSFDKEGTGSDGNGFGDHDPSLAEGDDDQSRSAPLSRRKAGPPLGLRQMSADADQPMAYSLDSNSRLQKTAAGSSTKIVDINSPLQRHITILAAQAGQSGLTGPVPQMSDQPNAEKNVGIASGTRRQSRSQRIDERSVKGVDGTPAPPRSSYAPAPTASREIDTEAATPQPRQWHMASSRPSISHGDDDARSGRVAGGARSVLSQSTTTASSATGKGTSTGGRLSRLMSVRGSKR